eukprot:GHVS01063400.1.p1 GENE.GHVS01063400.1~~GHVS01063400.1.p1  ORF type:complete len:234 (+),score=61.37 GHVS01063400.1:244-945(+)
MALVVRRALFQPTCLALYSHPFTSSSPRAALLPISLNRCYHHHRSSFCSTTTSASTTPDAPPIRISSVDDPSCPVAMDAEGEVLTDEERKEKEDLIKELTRRLSGPLADENGVVPTGSDRPTAIEVDGPSHFYANSTRYTAYTKLKHRLLTRMGYKVLHVPYFEWRKMRGAREREEYMRKKLEEQPTEWLDPEDEQFYRERLEAIKNVYGGQQEDEEGKKETSSELAKEGGGT